MESRILDHVVETMAAVLGTGVVPGDNFFALGGDSLAALEVASRLQELTDRDVPLDIIYDTDTVADLSTAIEDLPLAAS